MATVIIPKISLWGNKVDLFPLINNQAHIMGSLFRTSGPLMLCTDMGCVDNGLEIRTNLERPRAFMCVICTLYAPFSGEVNTEDMTLDRRI